MAADVTFVNHDVIYLVLRNLDKRQDYEHIGCIEVMDNVFIGLGSIILSDVKIGQMQLLQLEVLSRKMFQKVVLLEVFQRR